MSDDSGPLPVPANRGAHWRVVIRPTKYAGPLLQDLKACQRFVEQHRVRMRGWDFPALSHRLDERSYEDAGLASWCNFFGSVEYWKLFKSGQFLHLSTVAEISDIRWREELSGRAGRWDAARSNRVPKGFIDLLNSLYKFIEIFEFAKRLSQNIPYTSPTDIIVQLHNISGFELTAPAARFLPPLYVCNSPNITIKNTSSSLDLIANQRAYTLRAFNQFLQRFGLVELADDNFGRDFDNFVTGRF